LIHPQPVVLEGHGVRLEPMAAHHAAGLVQAASDGRLWELWFTSVPAPDAMDRYIDTALQAQQRGVMLPWVVCDAVSGNVLGSSRYHDIVAAIDRVEIGYTWYAEHAQRTHVNSACKILLLKHAFETLGCAVVGFRTDNFNFRSQKGIEALGARKDGVLRHHQPRPDGSARDTVFYSILASEWPDVQRHLLLRLQRLTSGASADDRNRNREDRRR
jgi:RimJ/RimL family protein N-acetyltransferase